MYLFYYQADFNAECLTQPDGCQNGGSLVNDECECPEGFVGRQCQFGNLLFVLNELLKTFRSLLTLVSLLFLILVHLHELGPTSWVEANRLCQEINGRLPEVRTEAQFWEGRRIARGYGQFWLGGTDLEEEDVFRWLRNDEVITMDRFFWVNNEPQGGRSENCLKFAEHGFSDGKCDDARHQFLIVCDVCM